MPFTLPTYHLAELARHKLLVQAAKADHDLRQLVLNANLLDGLLAELDMAELQAAQHRPRRKEKASGISPALALQHARLHGTEQQVVVMEVSEDAVEDEETSPPLLAHDLESEEEESADESSDEESEEDQGMVATSPTTDVHKEGMGLEKEEDLKLHRTGVSKWRGAPWVR